MDFGKTLGDIGGGKSKTPFVPVVSAPSTRPVVQRALSSGFASGSECSTRTGSTRRMGEALKLDCSCCCKHSEHAERGCSTESTARTECAEIHTGTI